MTPPKAPRAGELLKQKKQTPLSGPCTSRAPGKGRPAGQPLCRGAQGAWTPTTSLPAAAA